MVPYLPTYIKEENTDKVKEIDRDYRERETEQMSFRVCWRWVIV